MKVLLEHEASVHIQDCKGRTPLEALFGLVHDNRHRGDKIVIIECAMLLLESGAQMPVQFNFWRWLSSYHERTAHDPHELVKTLLERQLVNPGDTALTMAISFGSINMPIRMSPTRSTTLRLS